VNYTQIPYPIAFERISRGVLTYYRPKTGSDNTWRLFKSGDAFTVSGLNDLEFARSDNERVDSTAFPEDQYGYKVPVVDMTPPETTPWQRVMNAAFKHSDTLFVSQSEIVAHFKVESVTGEITIFRGIKVTHQYTITLPGLNERSFPQFADCIGRLRALELDLIANGCIRSPSGAYAK
jgi:hypothetical protein